MKRFNPEKELRKIEKSNRNKIIVGICSLLLIIAIGSTYALYQVRHTNKLVFNTVDEFIKKDITVSVLIDNESKPEFPAKEDGYLYSGYECENDGVITFDDDNWKFTLENNKPDKCVIKFTSKPFNSYVCKDLAMSECLLLEDQHTNKELAFDDPDGNARYIGTTPSNYIWFNCDDYSNPTEDTCERWRIIGSFKEIQIVDEKVNTDNPTKENLVKIIRAEGIGRLPWDSAIKDNWENSSLQKDLKDNYLTEKDTGNWIQDDEYKDQAYKAITSVTLEKTIEEITWKIGGLSTLYGILASAYYDYERGEWTYNYQPSKWNGKVALMYPSDFTYATGGGETGRKECFNQYIVDWGSGVYQKDCGKSNWLYDDRASQWTLMPHTQVAGGAFIVTNAGSVSNTGTNQSLIVRPTLYLKHNMKISGGDGTYENPYTIAIQ